MHRWFHLVLGTCYPGQYDLESGRSGMHFFSMPEQGISFPAAGKRGRLDLALQSTETLLTLDNGRLRLIFPEVAVMTDEHGNSLPSQATLAMPGYRQSFMLRPL